MSYLYKMKPILFIAAGLLSLTQGFSQTRISGQISDEKNKPVKGSGVNIFDSYDGATSDSSGRFSFNTTETGKHILVVTAISFSEYRDSITVEPNKHITLSIKMKSATKNLDAVVITAGSFAAGDQSRSSELSTLDIITTASANADITGAIKTLPGTQQVGESEGLFVHGGTADESKIYIDCTQVNNFFFTSEPAQASRGRFSPFLFKGTVFSSGGYSALYGQALSSVLLLESIDLPERTSGTVGLSYLSANAGIQELAKNKKSSWGVDYGYTNLALAYNIMKQKNDYSKVPELHDLHLNYRIKTSSSGMLKYYGYFNSLQTGFRYHDIDSADLKNAFQLRNSNTYHNVSWRQRFDKGSAKLMRKVFRYSCCLSRMFRVLEIFTRTTFQPTAKRWLPLCHPPKGSFTLDILSVSE